MSREGDFRFRHPVQVRFQDIDALGHAHHSRPLIYFEEARWAFWKHVVGTGGTDDARYVIADFHVRYHARILFPDTLDVGVRVTELGRKHFLMAYEALSEGGVLVASGESTQVVFDYAAGKATPIPEDVRSALEDWDGPF